MFHADRQAVMGRHLFFRSGVFSGYRVFHGYSQGLSDTERRFGGAIDINVDYEGAFYAIFYAKHRHLAHGIAIKYVADPTPGDPVCHR
jgi:hypothetical protein